MNKVIKMVLHDRKMTRGGNAAIKMVWHVSEIEKKCTSNECNLVFVWAMWYIVVPK